MRFHLILEILCPTVMVVLALDAIYELDKFFKHRYPGM